MSNKDEKDEIVKLVDTATRGLDEIIKYNDLESFAKSVELPGQEVSTKCKFCKSAFKEEGEELYLKGKTIAQVHSFLREKGEEISWTATRNHIADHLGKVKEAVNLRNYAGELKKWNALNKSDELLFNRYITMLDREANLLLAEGNEIEPSERRKNIEVAIKLTQTIGYLKEQVHKLQVEKRPVELLITSLNKIVEVKIQNCSDPDLKKILSDIIEELKKEVGELSAEGDI